jgi:hypothetical protein
VPARPRAGVRRWAAGGRRPLRGRVAARASSRRRPRCAAAASLVRAARSLASPPTHPPHPFPRQPPLPSRHEDRGCGEARTALLSHLRLLRNACAAGAPAAAALMRAGAHCAAPAVAAEIQNARVSRPLGAAAAAAGERQLLAAACQLLANFSVASPAAAAAIWGECFPDVHQRLTATADGEAAVRW